MNRISFCGFVSIIGEANAGKSTLLNNLIGADISIVTHKAQTTRKNIKGISIYNDTQIVFIDTPGIFNPTKKLDQLILNQVKKGINDAEIIAFIIDGRKGITENIKHLLININDKKNSSKQVILLVNKIDLLHKKQILDLSAALNKLFHFDKTFMISAKKKYGLDDLRLWVSSSLPEGPWLYPADQISDISKNKISAEITRKKIFELVHDELPYQTFVKPEKWKKFNNGSIKIEQLIFVSNDRHKAVLLGSGGKNIKSISISSRKEIEIFLNKKVHLFLRVKVLNNWHKNYNKILLNNYDI